MASPRAIFRCTCNSAMVLKVSRRGQVPPFIVMDVMRAANERAATGADVLHLEVGQPSTGAPAGVIAAAQAALGSDTLGYTEAFGLPALRATHRQPLSRQLRRRRRSGADRADDRLVGRLRSRVSRRVRAGRSRRARVAELSRLSQHPDRAGARSRSSSTAGPAQRYQATVDLVRNCREPIDGLIIASPANPTGTMLSPAELAALAAIAAPPASASFPTRSITA